MGPFFSGGMGVSMYFHTLCLFQFVFNFQNTNPFAIIITDVEGIVGTTGVTSADSLRTEKTLPELTAIKAFPSTIFVGRDGKVKYVHAGFAGPATGMHHEAFRQEFERTISELSGEKG